VQHTRGAESIHASASRRAPGCLLSSSGNHESESANTFAHSLAGSERDLDSVRHRSEARSGGRNQVVR
jgi:hypothetical protein